MSTILKRNLERDYGLALSWRFAEVEFLGLPKLKDDRVFRLEDIYVPLRLCQDWEKRFDQETTSYLPQVLHDYKHVVVLGDPGSGKSTIVKVLTYAFGEAGSNVYKRACGELTPIPIILRDYGTRRWRSYVDMLQEFVQTLDESIRNDITPNWLMQRLVEGKAILLIDGLDEVGLPEERLRLREEIIFPLLEQSRESHVLLTSRIVGYEEAPFDVASASMEAVNQGGQTSLLVSTGFEVNRFYVAPFNDEEIGQFVTRWYKLRETFPDKQREGVDSLMRALNQNDRVKQLAHNPQLLTLVALIHRVTANLPSGRVELYDKIVEAYLETIQVFRKLGTPAKLEEMKRWLGTVGWRMQVRRDELLTGRDRTGADDLLVSREDVTHWLIERITEERGSDEASQLAEAFLDYVAKRSGLLVPRGPNEFSFAHLTFQEYFAAFELRGRIRRFEALSRTCSDLVKKQHWHETLNLLFEMLTEFRGACDDLLAEMLEQTADQDAVAQFLSALILDEQNGLSAGKQCKAIEFVLSHALQTGNYILTNNLRSLFQPQFEKNVREPLLAQLRHQDPRALPASFFSVGRRLLDDWPTLVLDTIRSRHSEPWTTTQVSEMVFIAKGHDEAVLWASERLPLVSWLGPAESFASASATTLIELNLYEIVRLCSQSPKNLFLAQLGLIFSTTNALLVRAVFAVRMTGSVDRVSDLIARFREDRKNAMSGSFWFWFWLRPPSSISQILALTFSRSFAGQIQLPLISRAVEALRQFIVASESRPRFPDSNDKTVEIGSDVEWLAFQPDASAERALNIAKLNRIKATDDWTRLHVLNYLLTLGRGTPALCRELNALLDKAVQRPEAFTFPKMLRELTSRSSFRKEFPEMIKIFSLHSPRKPTLDPKWFEPDARESRFFLSTPDELINVLEGITSKLPDHETASPLK